MKQTGNGPRPGNAIRSASAGLALLFLCGWVEAQTNAATNDAAALATLIQGGKVVAAPHGFDVESAGKVYHAVRAPHGYDVTGPGVSSRLIRTDAGFDVVPVTTNRLRAGTETAATERQVQDHARSRKRSSRR